MPMMKKKRLNNKLIFFICYLAYTSIYVARLNISMASPSLKADDILNAAQIGILGSVFSCIYACGRFINGKISDSLPPWLMICSGLAVAGISNIFIGYLPPFIAIVMLWGANAYAQSMLWSSILRIVSLLYSEDKARKISSYMVTAVAVGNIAGILFNNFIIARFEVRFAFIIPGGITLIMGAFVFFTTKNIKNNVSSKKHISVHKLFQNNELRLIIIPAMLHGAIKDNISLWMALFFAERYHIQLNSSANFVLFIPIIGFVGRTIYPLCYKVFGDNEHKVAFFSFLLCAVAAVMCLFDVPPIIAAVSLSIIYAAVSIVNTSFVSIFPLSFQSSGNVASVSGLMDFFTYFGAGIGSFVYGFIIEKYGYTPMFFSWMAISLVSAGIMIVLLKKKRYVAYEKEQNN